MREKQKILVVDGNEMFLKNIQILFEEYQTLIINNKKDAIKIAIEESPDLIILDINPSD